MNIMVHEEAPEAEIVGGRILSGGIDFSTGQVTIKYIYQLQNGAQYRGTFTGKVTTPGIVRGDWEDRMTAPRGRRNMGPREAHGTAELAFALVGGTLLLRGYWWHPTVTGKKAWLLWLGP